MEFNVRLNYDRIYQFKLAVVKKIIINQFASRFIGLFSIIYLIKELVELFIILFLPHNANLQVDFVAFLIVPFIVFIGYRVNKRIELETKQMLAINKLSYFDVDYKVSDEGIQFEDRLTTMQFTWDQIDHFETFKHFFAFYISKVECLIIPKEFLNEESTKQLLQMVRTHLPKKKIKK